MLTIIIASLSVAYMLKWPQMAVRMRARRNKMLKFAYCQSDAISFLISWPKSTLERTLLRDSLYFNSIVKSRLCKIPSFVRRASLLNERLASGNAIFRFR